MSPQVTLYAVPFLVIVCALLLLLTAINLGRALFGRGGLLGAVAPAIAAGGLLAAASIYFVRMSDDAAATAVARQESISVAFGGIWWRTTSVDVRFQPAVDSQPLVDRISLDTPAYDQVKQGATVAIRFLPSLPSFARLDQESTPSTAAALLPASPPVVGAALASALALWLFVYAIGAGRIGGAFAVALISAAIAAGVVAGPALAPPLASGPHRTTAQVSRIDHVHQSGSPIDPLVRPFDVVVLAFTPEGMDHPVQAVDVVDGGSVASLRLGQDLPIAYGADPRAARIVGATRANEWMDRLVAVGLVALAEIVICAAMLLRRAAPVRTVANAYRMRRLGACKIEASALITAREAAKRLRGPVKPPELQETRNVDGSLHSLCLLVAASGGDEIQVQVDQADSATPSPWDPRTRWDIDKRAIAEYGGRLDPVRNLGVDAYWTGHAILNVLTPVATLRFVFPDGDHRGGDERLARKALDRLGAPAPTDLVVTERAQATAQQ